VIESSTRVYAVIGDPIEHSLSPALQNWLIRRFDLDAVYVAFRVIPDRLKACVDGIRALGLAGINVTVPHKQAVIAHVDRVSPEVERLGAANTLVPGAEGIEAHVTDPVGFLESLSGERERFRGAAVVLLGAGGAAQSVSYVLGRLGVAQLTLTDLESGRAERLADLAQRSFGLPRVTAMEAGSDSLSERLARADVIINATPVGMSPHTERSPIGESGLLHSKQLVYDLIYNPATTRLLADAAARGAAVKNGLDMLIEQGVASLRLWTGKPLRLGARERGQLRSYLQERL